VRKTLMIAAAACLSLTFGAVHAAAPAAKYPAGIQAKEVTEPPTTVYTILGDAKGMTIYTFDKDVGGKSTCNGECAKFWLPVAAEADAKPMGAWTIITRDDGSKQWAYKNQPIYTFIKDTRVGDFDGMNQPKDKPVWKFILLDKKTAPPEAPAKK
jgi:predicted lipoprotein with Yx(FWY)xxD motif